MKTEEDEAFDELAKRQGDWGGGFKAKQAMAADKLQEPERAALELCDYLECNDASMEAQCEAAAFIRKALAQPADNPYGYDWSMLEAAQESLREHMARIKELEAQLAQPAQEPDALTIAYQSGYYDGKQAALAGREWNFCERCGKRTNDIHTCTPPQGEP